MPVQQLHLLIQYVQNRGVDVSSLLTASGVDLTRLLDVHARLPWETMYRVWANMEERVGESTAGLAIMERVKLSMQINFIPSSFLLPQLLLSSATLDEGLERMARYSGSMLGLGRWQYTRSEERGVVRLLLPGEPPRSLVDLFFFWPIVCADVALTRPVVPIEVRCSLPPPARMAEYEQILKTPIQFGCSDNVIEFAAEDLSVPSKRADIVLCQSLELAAEGMLARLFPPGGLIEQVKGLIRAELGGRKPSAETVAWALGMSPRTLARKLAAAGTSYQDIVDQIRAEQARQYLEQGLSVQEVSQRLGFAFPSSFCRAYVRWFGHSPGGGLPVV